LDADLVREASDHVEWLMQCHPEERPERLGHTLMTHDPFWVRLISDDRLLDIAELFVGPNIALFASHYLSKPPVEGMPVLWHQDGSYWPLEPMEVHALQRRTDVDNVLSSEIDPTLVDESQAVDLVLKAGDVSVHHPNIIHGSNANTSTKRRCGLTIRYIPTSTRIRTKENQRWASAFLLRGAAVPGVNEYHPRPRYVEGEQMPFRGCEAWAG
jgi:hypothetical protein